MLPHFSTLHRLASPKNSVSQEMNYADSIRYNSVCFSGRDIVIFNKALDNSRQTELSWPPLAAATRFERTFLTTKSAKYAKMLNDGQSQPRDLQLMYLIQSSTAPFAFSTYFVVSYFLTEAETVDFSEGLISPRILDMADIDARTRSVVLNSSTHKRQKAFSAASANQDGPAYGKGEQYEIRQPGSYCGFRDRKGKGGF
jgi:hypothetical protein